MMKHGRLGGIVLLIMALLGVSCSTAAPTAPGAAPSGAAPGAPTAAAAAKAAPTIKVGMVGSLSGSQAIYGTGLYGQQYVYEQVNKAGGIKSMGGAKIEWVVADTATDPNKVPDELRRLVSNEKVQAIGQVAATADANAGATVYDTLKVPVITQLCSCEATAKLKLNYWRMLGTGNSIAGAGAANALKDLLNDELKMKTDRVAIVVEDIASILLYRDAAVARLADFGWSNRVVFNDKVSNKIDVDGMSAIALKVRDAKPDVVMYMGSATTMPIWFKALNSIDYSPPASLFWVNALATEQGWKQNGDNLMEKFVNNKPVFMPIFSLEPARPEMFKKAETRNLVDGMNAWLKEKSIVPTGYHLVGAQLASIYVSVWERLGTADPEKVNAALKTLKLEPSSPYYLEGVVQLGTPIQWQEDGFSNNGFLAVVQWQKGKIELVSPKDMRTATPLVK